jgi:hypothetical protein
MPNYRNMRPAIIWGDAYENTLFFGYPLDEANAYPLPREGSEVTQGSSGVEDAWDEGTDEYLKGRARWIPRETGNTPEGVSATGWEGATGWREALKWMWRKNVARWAFDRSALGTYKPFYLVAPHDAEPELESNYTRALSLVIRSSDQTAFEGY